MVPLGKAIIDTYYKETHCEFILLPIRSMAHSQSKSDKIIKRYADSR